MKKMDTSQLTASNRVTVQLVKESQSKQITILSAGSIQRTPEGKDKFVCLVEIDGTRKDYQPNKESIKAFQNKYGMSSDNWVGKQAKLEIKMLGNREAVVALP